MLNPALALAAVSLAIGALPAATQTGEAPPRWHLDGATSRCVLTRRLHGTPGPAAFVLRTFPGSGSYEVMLAAPDLARDVRHARLSLPPGGARPERRTARIDLPRGLGEALAITALPAAFAREFAAASRIDLADDAGRPIGSWALPAAARAAEALAACEAEKQIEWGADPRAVEPGATPALAAGESDRWLNARDLGLGDLSTPALAAAVFRLSVGADGRATDCEILESAATIEIDRSACRILARRARYEPARDASGNPVRSVAFYRTSSETNGLAPSPNGRARLRGP